MSFTLINVRKPSFQRSLTWAFIIRGGGNDRSRNRYKRQIWKRSGLKDGPDNPLEVILLVSNHGWIGGARSNKRSDDRCNSESRSMYRGGSRGVIIATLGGSSASKLVFAILTILAKTATSGGLNHQTGWVRALNKELLNIAKPSFKRASWPVGFEAFRIVNGQSSANDSTRLIRRGCSA